MDDYTPQVISAERADHYVWGAGCDGWFLARSPELTLIQERMPPGAAEVPHYHRRSWQFFFILAGRAVLEVAGRRYELGAGEGLEVLPGIEHQLRNDGEEDLAFLVISRPDSHGDRVPL